MKTKKKKVLILFGIIAVLIAIVGASLIFIYSYSSKIEAHLDDIHTTFSVTLDNGDSSITVNSWEDDKNGMSYLFLPSSANTDNVTISCEGAQKLTIDGQAAHLGEETTLLSGKSECTINIDSKKYETIIMYGSDIPTMHIDTESGSLDGVYADKSYKEKACVNIFENGELIVDKQLKYIKGRGNISFEQPQKSLSIKFEEKIDLFGMGEAKKYALITTYTDQTQIKNNLAYSLADTVGLEYTSKYQPLDLYINGNYLGAYLLVESIEPGENRININDLDKANENANAGVDIEALDVISNTGNINDTSAGVKKWIDIENEPEDITSGYLLEIEARGRFPNEKSGFVSKNGQAIVLKSPEYATHNEVEYISDFYQDFENALYSSDGMNDKGKHYTEYIDIESFAKLYILEEFSKNQDANNSSTYMYLDESGIIKAGPAWDFENAFGFQRKVGQINHDEPANAKELTACTNGFFSKLCLHDDFRNEVYRIWNEQYRSNALAVTELIDNQVENCIASANMNAIRWNRFSITDLNEVNEAYISKLNELREYINARVLYLDESFSENSSIIIYSSNGESTLIYNAQYIKSGESAFIIDNPYTSNKVFTGWNTSPDASGLQYSAGDEITPENEGIVLYAQWGNESAKLKVKNAISFAISKVENSLKYRIQVITN